MFPIGIDDRMAFNVLCCLQYFHHRFYIFYHPLSFHSACIKEIMLLCCVLADALCYILCNVRNQPEGWRKHTGTPEGLRAVQGCIKRNESTHGTACSKGIGTITQGAVGSI